MYLCNDEKIDLKVWSTSNYLHSAARYQKLQNLYHTTCINYLDVGKLIKICLPRNDTIRGKYHKFHKRISYEAQEIDPPFYMFKTFMFVP